MRQVKVPCKQDKVGGNTRHQGGNREGRGHTKLAEAATATAAAAGTDTGAATAAAAAAAVAAAY
jgi:hypothetical protein